MALGQLLTDKLLGLRSATEKLKRASTQPADESGLISAAESFDGVEATVSLTDLDKLAFVVSTIRLRATSRPAEPPGSSDRLREQAERLVKQIDYLPEDLSLIELDAQSLRAQIRGTVSLDRSAVKSYFELILRSGNQLEFARYAVDTQTGQRRQMAFLLATDMFARLIDDFAACLV